MRGGGGSTPPSILSPTPTYPPGASARSYWLGPPLSRHVVRASPAFSSRLCRAQAVGGGGSRACCRCGACARAGGNGVAARGSRCCACAGGGAAGGARGGSGSAGRGAGARGARAGGGRERGRRGRGRRRCRPAGSGAARAPLRDRARERGRRRSVISRRPASPGRRSARTPAGSPERGSLRPSLIRPVLRGGT